MKKPSNEVPSVPNLAATDADEEIDPTQTKVRATRAKADAPKSERPFATIIEGGGIGQMYSLAQGETVVGRAPNATIRVDDDGVSRRHVMFMTHGKEVWAEDLKSANGTSVNGAPLEGRRRLVNGDKIAIGAGIVIRFAFGDELDVTFQQRMLDAALRDGLTRTFNKRYLMERLSTELAFALRHRAPLSMLLFDLDHFKRINDTFGHPAGDQVLISVAGIVNETIRKEDVFARYGGEEFAVLCRSVDVQKAAILGERIRERIGAAPITFNGAQIPVTVSIGIAGLPTTKVDTPEGLIVAADTALYAAKRAGRNRVIVSE